MQRQQVPIELIVTNAGTQQRPIDEETLNHYLELIQDGVEFPPVEIIREAEKYYLWDGFHRLECIKRLERKFIYAYVKPGKLNEAIWASFGANKIHGFPRLKGIARKIIKKILCDAKWSKVSQAKIAQHVGVTKGYVSQVKSELLEQEKADSKPKTQIRGMITKPLLEDERQEEKPLLQRSETVETKSATGKTYEQKSQAKEHKPPKSLKDAPLWVIIKDFLSKK